MYILLIILFYGLISFTRRNAYSFQSQTVGNLGSLINGWICICKWTSDYKSTLLQAWLVW